MKKLFVALVALIVLCLAGIAAHAEIASGTWGTCSWQITDGG